MKTFINELTEKRKIEILGKEYIVKTKTWYSIEEDNTASYVKCELSDNKVLVIIPDDNLMYVGEVIENLKYNRVSDSELEYMGRVYSKTGDGHQYITKIEFGSESEVEGKCTFEDFECENNIISLGILTDKNNFVADVYADIIEINDINLK